MTVASLAAEEAGRVLIMAIILAITLAAIAGTVDLYDVEGKRVGTVREGPGGRVDVYDAESNRAGWGRRNRDGSIELFDADGRRTGTVDRNGVLRLSEPRRGERR